MSYIGNSPGVASQRVTTTLTATAGQTQFTAQSGYVLGYVDVYLNGAKLVNGADFEAITGTFITLFEGALAGDVVELVSYVPRGLSDGYTKAEADAKFLDVGGDTATGSLALATASLTGNLTLSGGTANGVAYLNGSKVVTTGSALTFDGNAFTSTGGQGILNTSGGNTARMIAAAGGTYFGSTTAADVIFQYNQNERMRLTNTGLGIGTASPNVRTEISGTEAAVSLRVNTENTGNSALNYSEIQLSDVGAVRAYWRNLRDGSGATIFSYNDHLRFAYQGTERARITSTGQISLVNASFQIQSPGGSISFPQGASVQTGSFGRLWNPAQQIGQGSSAGLYGMAHTYLAYYDAGWKSLGGGTASALTLDEGIFSFSNSNGVGATNSALTWTTRMLITTGGNVGIGTVTPGERLDVWGNIRLDSSGGTNREIYFRSQGSGDGGTIKSDKNLSFYAGNGSSTPTLYMTLKEGGNLGIGDSSPAETLTLRNASGRVSIFMASGATNQGYISYFNSTQTLSLGSAAPTGTGVNGGQQLNITNQGYVGIGITNPSNPLHVYSSVTPPGSIIAKFETASDSWVQIKGGNAAGRSSWQIGTTSSGLEFYNDDTSGYRVTITNSGAVGIGTRSPSMPLHVVGGSNVFAFTGSSSNSLLGGVDTLGFYIEQGGGTGNARAFRIQTSNGSNSYTGLRLDGENQTAVFQTSSTERFRIASNGYVGIGQSNPQTLLHLSGTNQDIYLDNFGVATAGLRLRYQTSSLHGFNFLYMPNDATAYIENTYQASAGTVYGDIQIRQNVSNVMTTRMIVKADGGRVGIGTASPAISSRLDVAGPVKAGRSVYNWYQWGGNPSGRYHHIKTSLWSGGSPNGNSQPTMSLFHIRGYNYDAHTIDAMIGFHNWSGAQYSVRVTNGGSYVGSHGTYTSTDGYVVLVIDTGTSYPGISIDYFQSFPYGYVDVTVTASSSSTSATGVY